MRRVATVLGVSLALGGSSAHAAPECEPSVRVSGDPDVASPIRTNLAERGLGEAPASACPPIEARVERAGERLRVEVVDGYGRRSQRDVRDSATAIALIETWARPEVVVGEDLPGERPAMETHASPAPAAIGSSAIVGTGIAVIAGADYASDGTTWARGGIAGCASVGPVCIGGRLELARATELSTSGDHPRGATSIAATVELPRRFGRIAIVPAVGVGGAWGTIEGIGPHMDQTESVTSLRLIGTIALRVGLARRWAIELLVGGEAEAARTGTGTLATPGSLGRAGLGVRFGGW